MSPRTVASFNSLIGMPIVLVISVRMLSRSPNRQSKAAPRNRLRSGGGGEYRNTVCNFVDVVRRSSASAESLPPSLALTLITTPSTDTSPMNISGTLNVFRLIRDPTLCLPHHTVSTFNHLPVPLSKAFATRDGEKGADIRAVVLDKDNCFAVPHKNEVYTPYNVLNSFCPNRIRFLFKSCVIFQNSSCCTVIGGLFLAIQFPFL
jgi:hypothetical protein